tara:strand:+ start:7719 stop:9908 length:2190 start_codon:yes stop_codon:yes gene_type:complete
MKKKDNISVIHLAEYNLPTITETNNKDWIQFGSDNLYPQYLLELYNGSSINNAIIKGVSSMIYGEGLDATDREDDDNKKGNWLALNTLLHNSPKDTLKCLAFDLKLFGMCYVNTIWNRPRTKIVEVRHIPAQYIRSGKADAYGKVNEYYYSADWENTRKHKPRYYKAFDLKDRTDANQVLCIKDYSPGSYYYATPDYQGSTSYIQLDMEIAQFHLSNIKSGMFPSMAINMSNGIPTREERRTIERQINAKFGGSGNAGKILLTFNDGKDTAPEIVPINANDNSDSYQFLSTETTRKVLTGHRVTSPLLFGVKGDGSGFGNNADELRDSYSLFNNTVIKPFQNTLLEGLEPILHANGIELDLYFKTLKPADFIDISNVNKLDEDEQEKEGIDTDNNEPIKKEFKDLKDIDTKPTKGMIEQAKIGLEMRKEYGRGGTMVAVARARNIVNGDNLSLETISRMNSFFARHEVDKKAEGFNPGEKGYPSAGAIAWKLWGGDAGQTWAKKKVEEIKKVREDLDLPKNDEQAYIEYFTQNAIKLDDDWEELRVDTVDTNEEEEENFYKFATDVPGGDTAGNLLKEATKIGLFKLYYRYSANISANSRDFCRIMVALRKARNVYTRKAILNAGSRAVNPGFGKNGSNTYSVWNWKGGVYCHHFWERVWYFRKRVPKGEQITIDGKTYKGGQVLPDTTIRNYKKVTNAFAERMGVNMPFNDTKATTAPINTPTRGKYS